MVIKFVLSYVAELIITLVIDGMSIYVWDVGNVIDEVGGSKSRFSNPLAD